MPAAVQLATVPAAPKSTSSGCAVITRALRTVLELGRGTTVLTRTRLCGCGAFERPGEQVVCTPLDRVTSAGLGAHRQLVSPRSDTAVGSIAAPSWPLPRNRPQAGSPARQRKPRHW